MPLTPFSIFLGRMAVKIVSARIFSILLIENRSMRQDRFIFAVNSIKWNIYWYAALSHIEDDKSIGE